MTSESLPSMKHPGLGNSFSPVQFTTDFTKNYSFQHALLISKLLKGQSPNIIKSVNVGAERR